MAWTPETKDACALKCGDFGEPPCWQVVEGAEPCAVCVKAATEYLFRWQVTMDAME